MTTMLDSVRGYAQSHPMSMAAGLIIVVPGTYLFISSKSVSCVLVGLCTDAPTPSQSPAAGFTRSLSVYESNYRLNLPVSTWNDKPAPTFIVQVVEGTRKHVIAFLVATGQRLGIDIDYLLQLVCDRWVLHYPASRFLSVAATTALPRAFWLFIRSHPNSWAAQHQTSIANALHVLAVVTVANQRISIQDLLVTTAVMVSFEALQNSLAKGLSRSIGDRPGHERSSAVKTLLSSTHSVVAKSRFGIRDGSPRGRPIEGISKEQPARDQISVHESGIVKTDAQRPGRSEMGAKAVRDLKDAELHRLRKTLVEAQTSEKNKEFELKRTQIELCSAREKLTETFAEYANLRDAMKAIKQTMGRNHQAVIYRKDIELFALRKGNEQKENWIKERDANLEEVRRQHKTALDLKDAQIRTLEERFAILQQQQQQQQQQRESPEVSEESQTEHAGEQQPAIQVKLLHVKGKSSQDHDHVLKEKDMQIAQLKADLASISCGSETLERVQDELRRAWDTTCETQTALNQERESHAETKNKLQEATIRLDEEVRKGRRNSLSRLPTIEESDKQELEAMFNAAQEDNLRLYTEHEGLEKRLREANSRVFTAEQELQALKEQLKLERAINEDMETARPSIVHRVHFQRMEGQLKESRDELEAKEVEIDRMKDSAAAKDGEINNLKKEKDAAEGARSQLQQELESVQKSVAQLEATKEQLMLDHERLAQHRTKQRNSSAEYTSARSSDITLITEPIILPATEPAIPSVQESTVSPTPPIAVPISEKERAVTPPPVENVHISGNDSIQNTPERVLRSPIPVPERADTNRFSMISVDIPPPELRTSRRRTLTLKSLMRKIVRKDSEDSSVPAANKRGEEEKQDKKMGKVEKERKKIALAPKDENASMRPKTSAAVESLLMQKAGSVDPMMRPKTAAPVNAEMPTTAASQNGDRKMEVDKEKPRLKTARYYLGENRPQSLVQMGESTAVTEAASPRSKGRGWSVSGSSGKKLVRKSIA